MKKTLSLSILVLGLALADSQLAQACGYACNLVSIDPICFECQYFGEGGSGSCIQTGPCSCYEVLCRVAQADPASPDFLAPDVQPTAACTETSVALVAN